MNYGPKGVAGAGEARWGPPCASAAPSSGSRRASRSRLINVHLTTPPAVRNRTKICDNGMEPGKSPSRFAATWSGGWHVKIQRAIAGQ
jgi:hypothetical protein